MYFRWDCMFKLRKQKKVQNCKAVYEEMLKVMSNNFDGIYITNAETGEVVHALLGRKYTKDNYELTKDISYNNINNSEYKELHKILIHPDDVQEFEKLISPEYIKSMLDKQYSFNVNYRMRIENRYMHYQTRFCRTDEYFKNHLYVVGIYNIEDEIEREKIQKLELQNALNKVKESNKEMTEFLYKMSQELRTPLNAILGFAHIALREADENEKLKVYLNHIIDSAEELLKLENNSINIAYTGKELTSSQTEASIPQSISFNAEENILEGKKFLLVEDNQLNALITQTVLEDWKVSVDIVENGQLALDRISSSKPGDYDIILMDLQMPVMDGFVATKRIRSLENKELASIPIIALTANTSGSDFERARTCGIDEVLGKPLNPKRMYEIFSSFLK